MLQRLSTIKRWLWLRNRQRLRRREVAKAPGYADWCAAHDSPGEQTRRALLAELDGAGAPQPTFTLQLALEGAKLDELRATWQSLCEQWYPHWRCLASGRAAPDVERWLQQTVRQESRLHWVAEPGAADWIATAPWIAALTPGELWRPHALALMAACLRRRPDALLIYADHDSLSADGQRRDPAFKPDWNPDWLLAGDWVQSPLLWQGEHFRLIEQGRPRGAHERLLRGTARVPAARIRHIAHVLVHRPADALPRNEDPGAVEQHLRDLGEPARTTATRWGVRVTFDLPAPPPRVSIVIPTRNGVELLRACVASLLAKTAYPDYEVIIVDNGSDDPACLRYLAEAVRDPRVRVRRDDSPFNFAALNNAALADCTGSVLALVNNDIEVIDGAWLREMVSLALRPGVGAVGARLLFGDGSVQHAGVILGIGGAAGHGLRGWPGDAPGPMSRLQQMMQVSAVTAACLVVQRAHYLAVQGMDAQAFPVAFNDIDLCLRLGQRGLRTLYTPHATLYHHESMTRGSDRDLARRARHERERERLVQRFGHVLQADPAYNPNLSLDNERFTLARPPRLPLHCPERE